jgi:hypothetical protein
LIKWQRWREELIVDDCSSRLVHFIKEGRVHCSSKYTISSPNRRPRLEIPPATNAPKIKKIGIGILFSCGRVFTNSFPTPYRR